MFKPRPIIIALFGACVSLAVQPTQAHDEFEITSTARLQHHRLEVTSIMTLQAGGVLLGEGNNPEFELRPENFELYQGRLQSAAKGFYEVTAGGGTLVPLQANVNLPEPGHLRFTVIYPQPASWPLKFRPAKTGAMPATAISDLGVYDQEERLLGTTAMPLHDPAAAELSVDPASPVPSLPAAPPPTLTVPKTATPDLPPVEPAKISPPAKPQSWLGIASGLALGLALLVLVVLINREKTSPTV